MKHILSFVTVILVTTSLVKAQPFTEREMYNASKLISDYCKMLQKYASGIPQERFGIEELFGNTANQVYNDLEPGSATIELSTYLNNVTKKQPEIQYGLLPEREAWEYVADDGQGRRFLVIAVPKEVDSRRITNVFYISLKEHPVTGETIVKLANIFQSKTPGYTYHKLKGGQPVVVNPPAAAFRNFTETVSGVPIEMVAITGGTFQMGSPESEPKRSSDETRHTVTVSNFYMATTELTFAQYDVYCEATGKSKPNDAGWGRGNRPVINVSWNDADAYCKWLSQQTGKTYRLPTEAEWEYAARAGTTTPFNTGNCLSASQANYDGNYPYTGCSKGEYRQKTLPVGSFSANAWGLFDMHGNVWEWCNDWYDAGYYANSPRNNPPGPPSSPNSHRVLRGGSWDYYARYCRVSARSGNSPGGSYGNSGFRLVHVPV